MKQKSSEAFKQKYAKGTALKPTLDECYNSLECKKHFLHSIKKYKNYLTEEEIYDLSIDAYVHTIKNFNGEKSCFLTFLYRISGQLANKKVTKKIRNVVKLKSDLDIYGFEQNYDPKLDLSLAEGSLFDLKFIQKMKNSEIAKVMNCSNNNITLKLNKLRDKLKLVV